MIKHKCSRYAAVALINTEAYRSGHNGPDSKSGSPHGLVGSNPTASAIDNRINPVFMRFFHTYIAKVSSIYIGEQISM